MSQIEVLRQAYQAWEKGESIKLGEILRQAIADIEKEDFQKKYTKVTLEEIQGGPKSFMPKKLFMVPIPNLDTRAFQKWWLDKNEAKLTNKQTKEWHGRPMNLAVHDLRNPTEGNQLLINKLKKWLSALEKSFPPDGSKYETELEMSHREAITSLRQTISDLEKAKCWCHSCNRDVLVNGIPFSLSRMILCPDCGNKRCPKANNHTFACTNSNEPNQVGSAYNFGPK